MKQFIAMTRVSLRQVIGGRRIIGVGLVALLPPIVTLTTIGSYVDRGALRQFHDATIGVIFLIVIPVVALILGSGALGDERRDGTLSFLVLRPIRREAIVGAKLGAAATATFIVAGSGALLSALVLGGMSGVWDPLIPLLISVAIGSIAYASVFVILGFITARAVLIGLIYVFVWESGISFAADSLATVSLFRIGLSAYTGMVEFAVTDIGEVLGSVQPGVGGALVKIAVLAAAAVAIGASFLRKRDLVTKD